jgi:hypothetical protein
VGSAQKIQADVSGSRKWLRESRSFCPQKKKKQKLDADQLVPVACNSASETDCESVGEARNWGILLRLVLRWAVLNSNTGSGPARSGCII